MVAIIGAGISGLSLAWYLQKHGVDYVLLEASNKTGGYIRTEKYKDCILELGPNSILCDNHILSFLKEIGLENELVEANDVSKARYIYKNGKYRTLPDNPLKLLFSNFFSLKTKLNILREPFNSSSYKEDETLEDFFTRRFGKEVSDYALNPFVSGIYAGDPKDLLLEETFPLLRQYEKEYGSVLRGFIKNKATRKRSFNFTHGMQSIPEAIEKKTGNILLENEVTELKKEGEKLHLMITENKGQKTVSVDKLIITTSSFQAQKLLKNLYPEFAAASGKIFYPPMCVIHSVYSRDKVKHDLNGFGALNPSIEKRFSAGTIWNSSVFANRCLNNQVLFTSFVGGSQNISQTQHPEESIMEQIHEELSKNFNITAKPVFQKIFKIEKAIPQYNKYVKSIKNLVGQMEKDNIYFSTNWIGGVSLSDCIKKSESLADKIYKSGLLK